MSMQKNVKLFLKRSSTMSVALFSAIPAQIAAIVILKFYWSNNQLAYNIFLIVMIVGMILQLIATFWYFFQWVEINDETITARSLFRIIRKTKWTDLKEIAIINSGLESYLSFVDKDQEATFTGIIYRTNRYIIIDDTPKNRQLVEDIIKQKISLFNYEHCETEL